MDFNLSELEENLEKLRKNKENVPVELLRTRYAKSYARLCGKIRTEMQAVLREFVVLGVPFAANDSEGVREYLRKCQQIIDEEDRAGGFEGMNRVLFTEYSVEKAIQEILPVYTRIREEAYGPYWRKHCSIRIHPETGTKEIYNDLIGMFWDPGRKLWIRPSDGAFSIMYPPEKEEGK